MLLTYQYYFKVGFSKIKVNLLNVLKCSYNNYCLKKMATVNLN